MLKVFLLVLSMLVGATFIGTCAASSAFHATVPVVMAAVAGPIRPRKLRVKDAVAYSGISRSVLYGLASQYPGLFSKQGASTLVDVPILDQILDAQPIAEIKG
jgi:hypothetical protein